jgi:group I intron endonuclease
MTISYRLPHSNYLTNLIGISKLSNKNIKSNFVVYCHTSPSGKKYVGITNSYKLRILQHQHKSNKCTAFASAIKKYGWSSFNHEILATGLTLHAANHLERFYIKYFNTLSPSGYNLRSGGDSSIPCEETKQRMRENSHLLGKTGSNNHNSKKYLIIKPCGESVIVNGLRMFCITNGLCDSGMYAVSAGKENHHKKHFCCLYNDKTHTYQKIIELSLAWKEKMISFDKHVTGSNHRHSKKYNIISPEGDVMIITGLNQFCRENGLAGGAMASVARGQSIQHKKFYCEPYIEGKYTHEELDIIGKVWKEKMYSFNRSPRPRGVDNKNSKTYLVTDPTCVARIIKCLKSFCRENGLTDTNMIKVAKGKYSSPTHKGWLCEYYNEEQQEAP